MQVAQSPIAQLSVLALVLAAAVHAAPAAASCRDGVDNDGNGLVDWPADPGCRSAEDPFEFEFDPGDLLVIDSTPDALLHIDPATGARRVLHAGPPFVFPQGLALDHHHGAIVSDTDADAIFRFDLEDGSLEPITSGGLRQ